MRWSGPVKSATPGSLQLGRANSDSGGPGSMTGSKHGTTVGRFRRGRGHGGSDESRNLRSGEHIRSNV
jgi:hypothetical protein